MGQLLLIGWKALMEALDQRCEATTRSWVKKFDIPVKYCGSRPTITVKAFNRWWDELPEESQIEIMRASSGD